MGLIGRVLSPLLSTVIIFVASWATEILGVDAIFGAFISGACTPRTGDIHIAIGHKIESVTVAVLLPLYFTLSGIRTVCVYPRSWGRNFGNTLRPPIGPARQSFAALNTGAAWGVVFIVVACAIVGKLGGCTIAARLTGMSWRESLVVGSLMNARG